MDADQIISRAWRELPDSDRTLLEAIRAEQWEICAGPLGEQADALQRSADLEPLSDAEIERTNDAIAIWIPQLRVVLFNARHEGLRGLDPTSYRWALTRVAWHEWGHALSLDRAGSEDIARGPRYLDLAPRPLANLVRSSGYRRQEYTHEIVAEIYSMLMIRRRLGQTGKPDWLHQEIYELVRRVAGWNQ